MANNTFSKNTLSLFMVDLTKSQKNHIESITDFLNIIDDKETKQNFCLYLIKLLKKFNKGVLDMNSAINLVKDLTGLNICNTSFLQTFGQSKGQEEEEIEELFNFLEVERNKKGDIKKITIKPCELKDFLIDNFHFCLIEGQISYYTGSCYRQVSITDIRHLLSQIKDVFRVASFKIDNFIKENLLHLPKIDDSNIDPYVIACKDRLLVIDENTHQISIKDNTADVITLNSFNVEFGECNSFEEFKEQNYDSNLDNALDLWCDNDNDLRSVLEEFTGSLLFRNDITRTAFVLYGGASCGKSTFCKLLKTMTGSDNTSNCSLYDLGDKFRCSDIQGKRLNWSDDIQTDNIKEAQISTIKKVISNEPVYIEWKGIQGYSITPHIREIMTCNKLPYFSDVGLWDRLKVIPFNHKFPKSDYKNTFDRNQKTINYLFCLAVEGLLRLLARKSKGQELFTLCPAIDNETEKVKKSLDHLYEYAQSMKNLFIENAQTKNISCKENARLYTVQGAYNDFIKWIEDNNYYQRSIKPTKQRFINTICSVTGLKIKKADLYIKGERHQHERFVKD